MVVEHGTLSPRLHWGGILAGVIVGLVTQIVLSVLGIAVGLVALDVNNPNLGSFATGTLIWMGIALAISSFVGGLTAARGVGFLTSAQGRFNGLLVGMLILMVLTIWTLNLAFRGLSAAMGLAGNVVTTTAQGVSQVDLQGALNSLGLQNEYQALVGGFNQEEVADIIAQADPALSSQQVEAAAATVVNVVRNAGLNIGNNFSDLSDLNQVVGRQVQAAQQALTGPELVARLQRRGLSQAQATEVAQVVQERFDAARTQVEQTVEAVGTRAAELAQATARTTATAGWIWLLMAGLIIGAAVLGGNTGGDLKRPERIPSPNSPSPTRSTQT